MNEKFIPLSVPNLVGNELKYVTDAIETEWVSTAGEYVNEFEQKISEYVNVPMAVSCQSGTAGLHTSLLLCDVTRDDAVLVPTLTFIAAVNPVKYIGAEPIFMDCDDSLCIDPLKLEKYCRECCEYNDGKLIDSETKRHIKAMVVVHVFGNMADMESIMKIACTYNIKIIEDATEALGTYYKHGIYAGKYAGTIGDVGVYSFNGNKIITTGGGGAIVSNDVELLKRAKHLTTQAKADELNFIHDEIGYNYRMTNIQAAIGVAQLEQLECFIKIKTDNYERYKKAVDDIPGLKLLNFRENIRSNHWFYALYCENEYALTKNELILKFKENNIQTRPIWGLISRQKPYEKSREFLIDKAVDYWEHIVNIPCSSNLTSDDVDRVIKCLKS